ncbi:MAG: hypothetical protein QUU85_06325, partial [Candidatus Eisenbacteria bacterium]|nr:hypothetical protein [Candidatus Eisenbacteria bacterium]
MLSWPILALAAALALPVAAGCLFDSDDGDPEPANRRPTVKITGGTPDPQAEYRFHLTWEGSDPDGSVVRYEWAVDDTTGETAWTSTTESAADLLLPVARRSPVADSVLAAWHTFYLSLIHI